METILIVLFIILGFSFITYLQHKHLFELEQLLKAKDFTEYKIFKREEEKVPLPSEPEELRDAIQDKSPDEIRQIFNTSPI